MYTQGEWFQDKQTGTHIYCDDAQIATTVYSPLPKEVKLANAHLIAKSPRMAEWIAKVARQGFVVFPEDRESATHLSMSP